MAMEAPAALEAEELAALEDAVRMVAWPKCLPTTEALTVHRKMANLAPYFVQCSGFENVRWWVYRSLDLALCP
jgi:hypothetical protein